MKKVLGLTLLLIWTSAATLSTQGSSSGSDPIAIKRALTQYLCYEVYWGGRQDYRLATPLRLQIRTEGQDFFAWLDELSITKSGRMAYFFVGRVTEGKAVVVSVYGYNMNLTSQPYTYAESRHHFESGSIINDTLTLRSDCTPRYDSATPEKEQMHRTVVDTIHWQLEEFLRLGVASYPRTVTLIVADFNVDYPSTYILIESPRELFEVDLQHPKHFDDVKKHEYLYPVGEIPIKPHHKELLAKIRKHGIVRTIVLTR